MKTFSRIVSLVLAIFLFMGLAPMQAQAASGQLATHIGFVTATSLRLRSTPGTDSATLDYAYNGEVIVVLDKAGEWYYVNYNLQTGYMHSRYLSVLARENAELGYGRVTGAKVNIRSGPGTGYRSLAQANIDDSAYIIGLNDGWYKIIFGELIGYIRSDYLALTEIPYENRDSQKEPLFFVGGKSIGVTPSAEALKAPAATTADQIISTAKQYLGVPYLWGGTTPNGFDCSGFVQYVFAKHGISLPRTSKQQYGVGTAVSKSQLQKGDLVFFDTSGSGVSHVGIYAGDDLFIHASTSKGVIFSSLDNTYWAPRYLGARRVL